MTRFLIVQHEDNCPADFFGQWWSEAGVELDIRKGREGHVPAESDDDHDAVVVLGGGMNCMSDDENPWLPTTRDLAAATIAAGKPFLGICLGHQLAAVAQGGHVGRKEVVSMGLTPVALTEAGRADRLLGDLPQDARAVQYNFDHVDAIPVGAVVLARAASDRHVQALRFADRAWGVQFHPECSPETFHAWTVEKTPEKRPTPPGEESLEELDQAVEQARAELEATWKPVALRFMQVVEAGRS